MASDAWPEDIPIWIDGAQKWMTGLTRRTTCDDVIYALLYAQGVLESDSTDNYAVFERWRAVERPLERRTKIVKVWTAWGQEQANVQFLVQRLDDYFIPSGAAVRTRHRHRRPHRQRAKHSVNCRCMGRMQCSRCGRLKAVKQLSQFLIIQEQKLLDLQQRVRDADLQIAEHVACQHTRRLLREGRDYVQDSYLLHHGSDKSSSGSEDSVDCLLLAIGEESLDEYLSLCENLHEVLKRLDQIQHEQMCLAKEIEAVVSQDNPEKPHGESEQISEDFDSPLEVLHVKRTRAVAASVLQYQQEVDVDKELQLWEAKIRDRTSKIELLQLQLKDQEQEHLQNMPLDLGGHEPPVLESTLFHDKYGIPLLEQKIESSRSLEQNDAKEASVSRISGANEGDYRSDILRPRRPRSRSRDKGERPKSSVPLQKSYCESPAKLSNAEVKTYNSPHENMIRFTKICQSPGNSDDKLKYSDSVINGSVFPGGSTLNYQATNFENNFSFASSSNCQNLSARLTRSQQNHSSEKCVMNNQNPHQRNGSTYLNNFPIPYLRSGHLELYSSKDDSGVASSDSSTDSGPLLQRPVGHVEAIDVKTMKWRLLTSRDSSSLVVAVGKYGRDTESSSHKDFRTNLFLPAASVMTSESGNQVPSADARERAEPPLSKETSFSSCQDYKFSVSMLAPSCRKSMKWAESSNDYTDAVPVIATCEQAAAVHPVSIISSGKQHKDYNNVAGATARVKTVRFADEMTSWTWCDEADGSDDTGLSSLQGDDVLVTLV